MVGGRVGAAASRLAYLPRDPALSAPLDRADVPLANAAQERSSVRARTLVHVPRCLALGAVAGGESAGALMVMLGGDGGGSECRALEDSLDYYPILWIIVGWNGTSSTR